MTANDRKRTLQAIHTNTVIRAVNTQERNVVLDDRPERDLTRKERAILTQRISGYCNLFGLIQE